MQYNQYRTVGFTTLTNGLLAYYSQLNISDAEMILIIQLEMFNQQGEKFPSNEQIAANTNFSTTDVANLIQALINNECLAIEQITDEQGRIGNQYSLNSLYSKLDKILADELSNSTKTDKPTINNLDNSPLNQLMRQFEIEFGRYLSPIEREEVAAWLNVDHYDPEIIKMALREAVLSQAYSLKYVDRILLNWQRHNLKTSSEVQKFLQRNR
ncbi:MULTISPECIES: DnaD domain-containing protein [unclassified Lactobacillus]|uniref:DnaD domain-containing protein n=1 Tax=unclassified Lactobacillus TaxID=2620435 RepID=UPI000EFB8588|nr:MULTISPECIES: DnaD domain protein [unclassified Lactobacillus]RMC24638.1 DnaD domain protein [Lactobacillus sp. ESL0247]RMC28910.1 DnaD domain protein [Lactobacillus sp. ESL0246]RMC32155.1 DnaD domain protein [Lactobacillus sp. ESL0245]